MESRTLLSFAGSVSGLPNATDGIDYALYGDTTGSVSASSETFHPGDGTSATVGSPSNPQSKLHAYSPPSTPYFYSPTISFTPSGGTAITQPLTLDSEYNNVTGKFISNSYGTTDSTNGIPAMTIARPLRAAAARVRAPPKGRGILLFSIICLDSSPRMR